MFIFEIIDIYYSRALQNKEIKILFIKFIILSIILALSESYIVPRLLSTLIDTNKNNINKYLLYLFCILVPLIGIFYYIGKLIRNIEFIARKESRNKFFTEIINKHSNNYKEIEIGNYVSRILESTFFLSQCLIIFFKNIFPYILVLLFINIYFFTTNVNLGLLLLINKFLILIIILKKGTDVKNKKKYTERKYYKLYDILNNIYSNILNTYINNTETIDKNNLIKQVSKYEKINYMATIAEIDLLGMINLVKTLIFFIFIYILIKSDINKELKVFNFFLIILYIQNLESLNIDINELILFYSVGEASFDFLKELTNNKKINNDLKIKKGNISIKNLSFRYNKKKKILKNLNLEIKDKEKISIIGKSGSGKTTIAKLLIKLHKYEGEILIDNVNINNLNNNYLRKKITYINQVTNLLDKTILENIKYGNNLPDEYIINFLKKYNLLDIFSNLEKGIQEKIKIGGSNLSLGMQKIIILSRGILKSKESLIVIIDEPLTSLDSNTREKVIEMIKEECNNKTLIIITHNTEINKILDKTYNINDLK